MVGGKSVWQPTALIDWFLDATIHLRKKVINLNRTKKNSPLDQKPQNGQKNQRPCFLLYYLCVRQRLKVGCDKLTWDARCNIS